MRYRSDEQETEINYDNQTGKWHIYSTFEPHARKWEKALAPGSWKEYTGNGTLIIIDGDLRDDYYLTVTKRRKMSEEQRLAAAERLRRARKEENDGESIDKSPTSGD